MNGMTEGMKTKRIGDEGGQRQERERVGGERCEGTGELRGGEME